MDVYFDIFYSPFSIKTKTPQIQKTLSLKVVGLTGIVHPKNKGFFL